MHVSQRHPLETQEEALYFDKFIFPYVVGSHQDPNYVLNMDQTPIFFSMTPGTTLEQVGAISVNVRIFDEFDYARYTCCDHHSKWQDIDTHDVI